MGTNMSAMARAEDKCPVDHKNMSKEEIDAMMQQYKKAGHKMAAQHSDKSGEVERSKAVSETASLQSSSDGCPVDHKNVSKEQIEAYMSKSKRATKEEEPSSKVYDVYGQELDRANLMPSTPNQLPSPGQKKPLSTDRAKSSIPKAGEESETWTYPSAQMFFNALKRKGKADGVDEADMDTVVAVHNDMNEKTWQQVLQWEEKFHCECDNPKLKQFMGKPHDLSPAARFRVWCRGYPMPFDRHDWIIDRCGKGEARYIIDYYYRDKPDPIEIHVRPALDSVGAAYDRVRNGIEFLRDTVIGNGVATAKGETMKPLALHGMEATEIVLGEELNEEEFSFLSGLTPKKIELIAADVQQRCDKIGRAFSDATDPKKMQQANVSVNYCMAQRICKRQAADFMSALESGGDETAAYADMTSCLDRFHIVARRVLLEASGITQLGPEFPAHGTGDGFEEQPAASASSTE